MDRIKRMRTRTLAYACLLSCAACSAAATTPAAAPAAVTAAATASAAAPAPAEIPRSRSASAEGSTNLTPAGTTAEVSSRRCRKGSSGRSWAATSSAHRPPRRRAPTPEPRAATRCAAMSWWLSSVTSKVGPSRGKPRFRGPLVRQRHHEGPGGAAHWPRAEAGLCLEVRGGQREPGADVPLWPGDDDEGQLRAVVPRHAERE